MTVQSLRIPQIGSGEFDRDRASDREPTWGGVMIRTTTPARSKILTLMVLSWVALGLSLPLVSLLSPVWTSAEVALGGATQAATLTDGLSILEPVVLVQSPDIVIERGSLHSVDSKGRALGLEASRAAMAAGAGYVLLDGGFVDVNRTPQTTDPEKPAGTDTLGPLIDVLQKQNFSSLFLRRSDVRMTMPDGVVETMRGVTGELSKRGRTSLQFKGEGELRGLKTAVEVSLSGLPTAAEKRGAGPLPLRFSLRNAVVDWSVDGRVTALPSLQLAGGMDINVTPPVQASWLGRFWSTSGDPKVLKAKGDFTWTGSSMAVSKASFALDGNEATGALSLDRRGTRPMVAGTLAFNTLRLGHYLPAMGGESSAVVAKVKGLQSSLIASLTAALGQSDLAWGVRDPNAPLVSLFDADVRVSAEKVSLGTIILKRTAATVSSQSGKVLADIAAVEFDGGRAAGQISGDFSGPQLKLGLRGRLDNLDTFKATSGLFAHPVLEGKGIVTVDLTGQGTTLADVFAKAAGRVSASIPESGRVAVDLRGLAAASEKRAVEGWSAGGRDRMAFDALEATFVLADGKLHAEKTEARIRDTVIQLAGTIDMAAGRLHVTAKGPLLGFSGSAPSVLQFAGPWGHPTISHERVGKAASITPVPPVP
jgi:AsmA protein